MRYRTLTGMPDNRSRPSVDSLLPNITKLRSVGSKVITDPADARFNPGSGIGFTNYFAAGLACTPARASWLTGLYPQQTRMYCTEIMDGQPALDPGFPTWGTILTDASGVFGFSSLDFQTAWIGKWHLSDHYPAPDGLQPYGFSYVWPTPSPNGAANEGASGGQPGYGPNSADLVSDAQIASNFTSWVKASGQTQPWCATVSFVNPHDITAAPIAFGDVLDPSNAALDRQIAMQEFGTLFPVATNFPASGFLGSVFDGYFSQGKLAGGIPNFENSQTLSANGVKAPLQGAIMKSRQIVQALRNADNTRQPFTSAQFARILDVYLWLCAMVDQQIGVILNAVWSEPSLRDRTVILFTSDHGEFGGSHGMLDKTGALYEEAIHVPLNLWFPYAYQNPANPGLYRGVRGNICSAVDFCPLVLALASGSESWRLTPALAHLRNRQSLLSFLSPSSPPQYIRPFALSSTDELRVDELTPETAGGQHHVRSFRDAGGKYVQYSYWQPCTDTIDPTAHQFVEFYDYALGNTAEMGNDYNSSPNRAAYAAKAADAFATEVELPPPGLSGPYENALANYVAFGMEVSGGTCPT